MRQSTDSLKDATKDETPTSIFEMKRGEKPATARRAREERRAKPAQGEPETFEQNIFRDKSHISMNLSSAAKFRRPEEEKEETRHTPY